MKHLLDRKDNIMKNITFTYDGWMDGEQGEACMTVMVDDERAEMLDVAFNAPAKLPRPKCSFSKIRQSACAMLASASVVGSTPAAASRRLKSRRSEL